MAKMWPRSILSRLRINQALRKPVQISLSVFRSLHLQLFLQLTRWRIQREPKKTAVYRSRRAALFHVSVHIIPLVAAMSLLILNMRSFFIGDMPADWLTVMQFASKLLEILIQASIATIMLAYIRNEVLATKGFPFGGLIAPFRTADVPSLWSLELWGCVTSKSMNWKTRLLLCVSFLNAVVLAALVGPSSAVLMLPRLTKCLDSSVLMLLDPAERFFPSYVNASEFPLPENSDYDITSHQLANGIYRGYEPTSVIDGTSIRKTQTAYGTFDSQDPYDRSIATIPTNLTSVIVFGLESVSSIRMPQLYVYTECNFHIYDNVSSNTTQYIEFGPDESVLNNLVPWSWLLSNTSQSNDSSSVILHSSHYDDVTEQQYTVVWSATPAQASNISMIAAFASNLLGGDEYSVTTCIISAYWATVTSNIAWGSPLTNQVPSSDTDEPMTTLASLEDKVLIVLDPKWCEQAFILPNVRKDTLDKTSGVFDMQGLFYALALSYVPSNTDQGISFDRAESDRNTFNFTTSKGTALTNYIDSSRLRSKFNDVQSSTNGIGTLDPMKLLHVEVRQYSTGYGYDTLTITVRLSLAVIMVYVTTTVIYLVYSLITGKVAHSWNTAAELTVLALNSQKPRDLENTSVGIDTMETFRRPVNIRVNQEDGSFEIVFDDNITDGYGLVETNQKY